MADYPLNWGKPVIGDLIADEILYTKQNFDHLMRATVGYVKRSHFTYLSANSIQIGPGVYHHAGTVTQLVWWLSALTYTLTGIGTTQWQYIYIDDSAIVTLGANELTATEFTNSSTAPTWTVASGGWYNGNDRCIGAVRIDGSGNILEFFTDGGDYVSYANDICEGSVNPSDTWTDVDLSSSIPSFSTSGLAFFQCSYVSGANPTYWRTNGQTSSTGHYFGDASATTPLMQLTDIVITDSSQIIEVRHAATSGNTIGIRIFGWFFPQGI